jgi:hypothetical protein
VLYTYTLRSFGKGNRKMAEGYSPTSGMKSAARRALAWKKEGKRGGTRIGLTRANQIVSGESLSESTVMRMYSFFSRHEVDKKATGFSSGEEGFPSPGRVAWDLWGGDAGFSWSRQKATSIKNKRMNKMSTSIWDGSFLGTLGKEQARAANAEVALDLEEEKDEPLEPEVVETPAPVVETPAPVVEAPAPVVETPAPVVETPVETPVVAPAEAVAQAPAPVAETPAEPVAEVAAPVEDAPTTTEPTA